MRLRFPSRHWRLWFLHFSALSRRYWRQYSSFSGGYFVPIFDIWYSKKQTFKSFSYWPSVVFILKGIWLRSYSRQRDPVAKEWLHFMVSNKSRIFQGYCALDHLHEAEPSPINRVAINRMVEWEFLSVIFWTLQVATCLYLWNQTSTPREPLSTF